MHRFTTIQSNELHFGWFSFSSFICLLLLRCFVCICTHIFFVSFPCLHFFYSQLYEWRIEISYIKQNIHKAFAFRFVVDSCFFPFPLKRYAVQRVYVLRIEILCNRLLLHKFTQKKRTLTETERERDAKITQQTELNSHCK